MIPVEAHSITKRFGKLTAVDKLDLNIEAGSLQELRSGAGEDLEHIFMRLVSS